MKTLERSCPSTSPSKCSGGTFAEEVAVRIVLLKFTLISGEHFSTSHIQMFNSSSGVLNHQLPEVSLPSEQNLCYLSFAGGKKIAS